MRRLPALPLRILSALAIVALGCGVAQANQRVEIVDYGIYDHVVTEIVPEPKDVAGERSTVSNIRVREQTTTIDAQRGRMFGYQFRVTDPALVGQTLTLRRVVPPLTNPKTGETATVIERDTVVAQQGQLFLNAYRFDYDWEMAEGVWRFQVLYQGQVLAEKKFKVLIPMN